MTSLDPILHLFTNKVVTMLAVIALAAFMQVIIQMLLTS